MGKLWTLIKYAPVLLRYAPTILSLIKQFKEIIKALDKEKDNGDSAPTT